MVISAVSHRALNVCFGIYFLFVFITQRSMICIGQYVALYAIIQPDNLLSSLLLSPFYIFMNIIRYYFALGVFMCKRSILNFFFHHFIDAMQWPMPHCQW